MANYESIKAPVESIEKLRNYAKNHKPIISFTQAMVIAIDKLVDSSETIFSTGDKIKVAGKKYICIGAGVDLATFAPMIGTKTVFRDMFCFPNHPSFEDTLSYQRI
jgi:hypothetical protein